MPAASKLACWGLTIALSALAGCRSLAAYERVASDAAVGDGFHGSEGPVGEGIEVDGRGDYVSGLDASSTDGLGRDGIGDGDLDGGPAFTTSRCYQGWCWSGWPTNQLDGVWAYTSTAGTEAVAVGRMGTVLRFSNNAWSVDRVGGADYKDIWGDTTGNAWIVGTTGTVLHRAAGTNTWVTETLPSASAAETLHGVWGEGAGIVWAVSDGQILRRNSSAVWTIHDTKTGGALRDVWGTGTGDVYVFASGGQAYAGSGATGAFVPKGLLLSTDLRAGFWFGSRVYAVYGANGLQAGNSFDGGGGDEWVSVHGSTGTNTWAVSVQGGFRVEKSGGAGWTSYAGAGPALHDVWALGAQDAVVCGDGGHIAYRSATTVHATVQPVQQLFIDVHVTATHDAFVLAASNTIRHIDASGAETAVEPVVAGPAGTPTAIWASSASDVWVGNSQGLFRRGATKVWQKQVAGAVSAIWGDAVDNLWVTLGQVVMRTSPGQPLHDAGALSTNGQYTAISGLGSLVVVGSDAGKLALWQGGAWTNLGPLATGKKVLALAVVDAQTIYAVVDGVVTTTVQRWTGPAPGTWKTESSLVGGQDLWASGGQLWVATSTGHVRRSSGSSWQLEPLLTHNSLQAIHGNASGRVFAVGAHSTRIYRP